MENTVFDKTKTSQYYIILKTKACIWNIIMEPRISFSFVMQEIRSRVPPPNDKSQPIVFPSIMSTDHVPNSWKIELLLYVDCGHYPISKNQNSFSFVIKVKKVLLMECILFGFLESMVDAKGTLNHIHMSRHLVEDNMMEGLDFFLLRNDKWGFN